MTLLMNVPFVRSEDDDRAEEIVKHAERVFDQDEGEEAVCGENLRHDHIGGVGDQEE